MTSTSYFGVDPGNFSIHWPGEAQFGPGCVDSLAQWASAWNVRKPILISDQGIIDSGLLAPVLELLRASGAEPVIYGGVEANPTISNVVLAKAVWHSQDCDGLIAFGGGSVIDVSKILLAHLCSDAPIVDVLKDGDALLVRPLPPFAAVPTTAGTGSESTTAALIKDEFGRKHVMRSRRCRPQWIALDPRLTLSVPRSVSACTGFDVVMHALGAATNRASNPLGEILAIDALSRSLRALPTVLNDLKNLDARTELMLASYLAGVAMSLRGVDGIHGLCTPLESVVEAPHAHVLAVVCEPLMRFNLETMAPCYARLAVSCGIVSGETSIRDQAHSLIEAICNLRELACLPRSLDDIGANLEAMPSVYEAARTNASLRLNGRQLSQDDIVTVYAAMRGANHKENS
ncbi:iron-containing alcohol dehydrogenase family protein [Cupriavidus sp. D384]|uniref:iron-containing alcohol dehydrogenase family protein n=1 Tax=Cupriavidus sp. D384 TaxID=1538095 RepID=UPI0008351462|nr:iron-containing alcohol dehydrogenase [Cupriavidus sp. D384]